MSTFQTISKLVVGLSHRILIAPDTGGLEGYTQLSDVVEIVASNHDHDSDYAALTHNHDSDYAALTHNHDSDYAALTHNHDSDYAALAHNHDSDYAALAHNHSGTYLTQSEIEALPGFGGGGGVPVGSMLIWGTGTAPSGWLICDGQAVSRSIYADLFTLLGVSFGIGDGSTTFNLPNLQGRFPLGASISYGLQSTGGDETVTLTNNQVPSHSGHNTAIKNAVLGSGNAFYGGNNSSVGGGLSHNNMPPYLSINFIIYSGV